eukprot:1145531-Pelagomonas_calceolata.AAC.1
MHKLRIACKMTFLDHGHDARGSPYWVMAELAPKRFGAGQCRVLKEVGSLGGPALYSTEMEALLQIAKAGGSSWRFYEGEGANLAWALAASRHWSPRLADLEEGLVQVW